MPRSIITGVNPLVFKWLRESSGWTIEDVSKKLKTSDDVINSIESGERNPTLTQLKELSKAYKRPLAAFLLSAPKPEKPKPKDFRMLPQKKDVFDKKTILILRKARMLQEISGELSKNIDYETKPSINKAKITDDPKSLADKYRVEFGFTINKQIIFNTPYEVFNFLRDKMEDVNILIFQDSMPIEDARGFALPDETPNVIVLSSKDSIEARIFSLMHEFAHIILGEPAIDFPDFTNPYQNKIESWCNQFSSSFLLSEVMAKSIFKENQENLTDTQTLNKISRKYKVSKGMLLFNMLKYDFISESEYKDVLDRYKPQEPKETDEEDEEDEEKKQSGGIPVDVKCLSMVGNKFVSLVANNYDRNHITYTDALNYLSIKSKNFDKVLAKASK
ncbi:MAG: XRE family transcriptional regulator [Candidatus Thermoplasmatota archaeon]|jgi:Zn-dependent peptidase ImmA (M78 family)/transcriptional regulator with XRE-family HTH domain|nr:XRE family transcriptional regulator [Candidatus Thermoplasmatota archaeon]